MQLVRARVAGTPIPVSQHQDMWSFGMLMLTAFTGQPFFSSPEEAVRVMRDPKWEGVDAKALSKLPETARELVSLLLQACQRCAVLDGCLLL